MEHLREKGYTILENNWMSSHNEIDIIAKKDDTLVIVEVKTRRSNYLVAPDVAVDKFKQRRLILAAESFVNRYNMDIDIRFDIISVVVDSNNNHVIEHIENAFYPV